MPDRPGETGSDVTNARVNRTSTSDSPASGPKRPGSAGTKATEAANANGTKGPRTRTRTRTGAAKPSGASTSGSQESPTARPRPAKKTRRSATSSPKDTSGSKSSSASPKPAAAAPVASVVADPVPDLATDPTTEITGLEQPKPAKEARQRKRRRSAEQPQTTSVVAPTDQPLESDLEEAPRSSRARTTPAPRRGRRVKRVIRRIELWSVLKLAIVLYTCMYLAVLLTVVVLWGLAYSTGQIDNIETFMGEVGLDNYRFYGDRMFKAVAAIGAVAVLAGTVLTVLWAALVNIISEITGGIRVVVIEEEPVRRSR